MADLIRTSVTDRLAAGRAILEQLSDMTSKCGALLEVSGELQDTASQLEKLLEVEATPS